MKTNCVECSQSLPRNVSVAAVALMWMVAAFVPVPVSAGPPVGINITYTGDWEPDLLFADAFKQSRNWTTSSGAAAPTDANGWPTHDANIYVWAGQALDMSGTYALSFNGQATVSCSGGTVSNQVYDPSTNLTTATVTMTNTDLNLSFTSTRRTSSGATNTGITNARLMRPTSYGAATNYPTSTNFTTPIKNLISRFGTIRFMDYLATNGNAQVNWSDRVPPAYASYVVSDPAYGWEGKGCPWEYAVILCNETGKDMWICIPVGATDAYIADVADLIAFGSDGANPYTSPQASPVYPPLSSNLKVYVEYSNEVWNTACAFTQSGTNHDAAVSEVNAGGSPLNFDGDTNDWNWAARRTAKRTVEISNIFRSVFGEGAMMARVRPVLESQEGYVAFWLLQQTHMLEDYYNCAGRVATPHPPGYYIYGGGGSAYYNPDNSSDALTLSNIWTSSTFDNAAWAPVCQSEAGYVLPIYGKRVAYEGGPSMDNTGHSESIKSQTWADPRMTTCVSSHQTTWDQNGGDLLCYFESTGDYQWAFAQDPAVLDTPKMLAIDAIDSSARASATYGIAIPGSVSASAYNSPEDWAGSNPSDLSANDSWTWTGYVVNNTATGAFSIKLNAGSSGTTNSADIYVDGGLVGTIAIPNTGSNGINQDSAALTTSALAPGTHGVLLKARSGSFGVNTIVITSSATAAPAFTTQPTGQTVTAGSNASFTATASGTPMPTYRWRVSTDGGSTWTNLTNTAPYSGTATDTLTISGATMSMNGHQYHCVATNSVGSATSNAATLSVSKRVPVISWPAPAAITYPTPLSATQLNATANVPGAFVYTPAAGTVLTANIRSLSVRFTPTDSTDYANATATQKLTVNKAVPVITWPAPTAITYPTPLSSTQLNATANVRGAFVYSPAAGTVLTANIRSLSVKFTPADTTDYTNAAATQKLTVNKAVPVITWPAPVAITYPTPLSATQLNATANVRGTYVYSPAAGTVLTANIRSLSVKFTPADTTDYTTAAATQKLTVNKAVPVITWPAPAAITYPTPLSATQLNATANVPGAFVYTPAAGALLAAGAHTLSVKFTPTDTTDYTSVTATRTLTVTPGFADQSGLMQTDVGSLLAGGPFSNSRPRTRRSRRRQRCRPATWRHGLRPASGARNVMPLWSG